MKQLSKSGKIKYQIQRLNTGTPSPRLKRNSYCKKIKTFQSNGEFHIDLSPKQRLSLKLRCIWESYSYLPHLLLQKSCFIKVLYISNGSCTEFNIYYFILYLFQVINYSIFNNSNFWKTRLVAIYNIISHYSARQFTKTLN